MKKDFSWLFVLAAILLVRWIAFEAFAERAIRKGDEALFRAPFGLRLLFGVALPGFIYAAGAVASSRNSNEHWWLSGMFIGFAVLIAYAGPPDIGVSKSAIYEQKWLGLWKERVQWENVDYATADPTDDSVNVALRRFWPAWHAEELLDRTTASVAGLYIDDDAGRIFIGWYLERPAFRQEPHSGAPIRLAESVIRCDAGAVPAHDARSPRH